MTQKAHVALLTAITLLAAGLRYYQIHESLWLDELHTAWTAAGDVFEVSGRAKIGNQSPPYYYLTWSAAGLFGLNEMALRLPSLVAGTALVPLVYVLVFGWTSSRGAALLTAMLTAIDRDMIYFSQEARPYALVQLVALGQILAFWKLTTASSSAREAGRRAWRQAAIRMAFSLATALLLWLHYTAALLLAGEVVWFVWLAWSGKMSPRYGWFEFCFDLLLAGAFSLPIYWHLREVFGRRQLWQQFVSIYPTSSMLRGAGLYLALPIASVALIGAARRLSKFQPSLARVNGPAIALVVCWLMVPVGLAWLSTWFELARLFFPRFLIASALALPMIAGFALTALPNRSIQGLFAGVMLVASLASSGMIEQFREDGRLLADRREDWRAAVEAIQHEPGSEHVPVLLTANLIEDRLLAAAPTPALIDYYCFPLKGIYRLDADGRIVAPTLAPMSDDLRQAIHKSNGWWLVLRGTEEAAEKSTAEFEARVARDFPGNEMRLRMDPWRSFGAGLHVTRVRFGETEAGGLETNP